MPGLFACSPPAPTPRAGQYSEPQFKNIVGSPTQADGTEQVNLDLITTYVDSLKAVCSQLIQYRPYGGINSPSQSRVTQKDFLTWSSYDT